MRAAAGSVPRNQRCEAAQGYLSPSRFRLPSFEAYLGANQVAVGADGAQPQHGRANRSRRIAALGRGRFPTLDDQRRAIGLSLLLLLTWRTPPCLVVILCAAGGAAFPIV